MCIKNPEAKLEQLRRSSVVEFEHLTKDEHPNPPLRALPEHSVLGDEHGEELEVGGIVVAKSQRPAAQFSSRQTSTEQAASSQHAQQTSSKKQGRGAKIGFTMSDFGTSFGKRDKGDNPLTSGPMFSHESSFSSDFGQATSVPDNRGFAERDFGGDSTNERSSFAQSSTDSTSHRCPSTTHHSIGPGHQITADGRIKAGEMTFNIPGFNSESVSEAVSPTGEALSPTATREGKNGQGLF